jgi:hypothetical protein
MRKIYANSFAMKRTKKIFSDDIDSCHRKLESIQLE